jgi:maleylpyruvate isomerase
VDERERRRAIAGAIDADRRLGDRLTTWLAAGLIDSAAPSRLPDWTIGHVLTHLARNADSIVRVLEAGARGETVERYPGGASARDAEIEVGAVRSAAELVDDVRTSAATLARVMDGQTRWDARSIETRGTDIPVADLPALRRRETEVHGVDLGLGYEAEDWPAEYVRLELRAMEMRWRARRPMGLTGLPAEALAVDPPTRLLWLYGRVDLPGLEPARVF